MDMTGEVFGKWTVVGMTTIYRARKNRTACKVKCKCGIEAIREPDRLRNGRTKCCPNCVVKGTRVGPNYRLRKPHTVAAINNYFGTYVRTAKRKNKEFELSREQFSKLVLDVCYYCGTKPTTRLKSDWDEVYANGIDRVDSSYGYTINNVVTCCWVCNSAKKNMTQEDFYSWIDKVYARQHA